MIRIALCDDQEVIRNQLKKYLLSYGKTHKIEFLIYEFENGTKLLEDDKEFDLVFMDYEFKNDMDNDGLGVVKRLRERQRNITVIFLSGYPDIVFDSFAVGTFRFLVKPIEVGKLTKALDDYLDALGRDGILTIKVDGINKILYTNDITYVEGNGKYCIIHLMSVERAIECHETLASIEERLPRELFFRCHNSYVVGFAHVESYHRLWITLNSGNEIRISRTKYKEFCSCYLDYLSCHW